ncbi:hypothetical protein DdX_02718 [Ditylenchus destructor]|uniref:Uncharacterized protein n=1 Tax=Ditylenchus destructor TaxID=166010 RepID=A0AAD4NHW4_9BILA|nr:hypothetical protein DdX_02718 [Ditylenchus destructor]
MKMLFFSIVLLMLIVLAEISEGLPESNRFLIREKRLFGFGKKKEQQATTKSPNLIKSRNGVDVRDMTTKKPSIFSKLG